MSIVKGINNHWYFTPDFKESYITAQEIDLNVFKEVRLPHTNVELPYNYFDDKSFQRISCYKKILNIPKEYKGKAIYIDFEGVMAYAEVYLNGIKLGEHKGGYTPFTIDLSGAVKFGKDNILTVVVDSTEREDIPPFGGVIDYLTFGGIYREVHLRITENINIENVFVKTFDILQEEKRIEIDLSLIKKDNKNDVIQAICVLRDKEKEIGNVSKEFSEDFTTISMDHLQDIQLWDINHPYLYELEVKILKNDKEFDSYTTRIGFREAFFKSDGFYLNGKKIKLMGLNRHQSYPYVGYAMPKRAQQKDADILKYELGLNIVRTSHYPQSRHFLDRCDEIGLLVFEEIPGWQHIGDAIWQEQVLEDVKGMILRDCNHPSIILWGVRINESQDNHDLYVKTNALARKLDPTRQTGGVRFLVHSELLEDVYTINDFVHDGGYRKYLAKNIKNFATYDQPMKEIDGEKVILREPKMVTGLDHYVPYLVTEYNGHMYPTKRYDQEERAMEHALRHARVQNASHLNEHISGAIGWCAFDYNTHADFGSGDKICYHGVMDMFRIPKFAAYAYKSQKDVKEEVVLEPVTYWSRGERSIGGVIPLVIFTNCDYIDFYYGEEYKGRFYPDKEKFAGLPHPPVIVDELTGYWGMKWEDARFIGYVEEKEVIHKKYTRNPIPTELEVAADDTILCAGDMDVTRVVVKALDQYGNIMPFLTDGIYVEVTGNGELIGPKYLSLIGGSIAFWVRTTGEKGNIHIKVCSERFKEKQIEISVE